MMFQPVGSREQTKYTDQLAIAIRSMFPCDCAISAECFPTTVDALFPSEMESVSKAVAVRRSEFAAGRIAARRALAEIGRPHAEIPAGADRAPRWPTGTIGSISHAGGVAVAVVAATATIKAIGIDIEIMDAVRPELWPLVLSADERHWLRRQPAAEQIRWATAVFSAKEAFYKFQYPLTGQWLDFLDVEVRATQNSFTASAPHSPIAGLEEVFQGRLLHLERFIVSALYWVRQRGESSSVA